MKIFIVILLTIFLTLSIWSSVSAQDRTVMNRHKFDRERPANVKHRNLTIDVDSSGINIYAWGDECFFKINLLDRMLVNANFYQQGTRPDGSPYIRYGNDNFKFRMYVNDGGNFEFDAKIMKKSPKGRHELPFNIETKGLTFYYQPELTQQEIDDGAMRPDSVIGSYAVYHSTKRDNKIIINGNDTTYENYRTGKAFHIYRPKVWDNAGDTTWGMIRIDTIVNRMFIGADSTWIANAIHPVTIDPIFGRNVQGGTPTFLTLARANIHDEQTYVASTGDIITSYSIWLREDEAGTTVANIVAYSMATTSPTTRLDAIVPITVDGNSFVEYTSSTVSHALVSGTRYCVAAGEVSAATFISYDILSGTRREFNTVPLLSITWTTNTSASSTYGMYATYTIGGEPPEDEASPRRRKEILKKSRRNR